MDMNDILNHDRVFRHRLLDRMRGDCEYYLGYGNRYAKHLWAGNEKDQIECMKALWNSFTPDDKPHYLSYDKILEYESKMVKPELSAVISSAETKAMEKSTDNTPVKGKEAER